MKDKLKSNYASFLKLKHNTNNRLFGNKEYKKYIIISTSRTGSTLLMALLNSHKNIICDGELFKDLGVKTCKEIWINFFNHKPKNRKHVGFKLF
jgi:LPS sulfotransferase NodH